jgi:hypothetical protein
LGGDELRPKGLRLDAAQGGFDIASQESVEQVVGQEDQQGKGLDRLRIVFIDVIGVPTVHQFIEAIVFDVPARMSQMNDQRGGGSRGRQGRHPHPFALLLGQLFVRLAAHLVGFFVSDT